VGLSRAGLISALLLLVVAFQAHAAPPGVEAKSGIWRQADGEPLFTYMRDTAPGQSSCTGPCAGVWSPIIADAGAAPDEGWTIEEQTDGRRIWVFQGKPVYRLIDPEKRKYKGASALWHRSRATHWFPQGVGINDKGFLVMTDGRTLKTPSHRVCNSECKSNWLPLEAPPEAVDRQDWTVVQAPDGVRMWAYGVYKHPVYVEDLNAPPPTPPPNQSAALLSPAMSSISAVSLPPELTLIALNDGAYDMYDPAITALPQRAPGWQTPEYPPASLRAREQGWVTAQICVGPTGGVTSHAVAVSSGYPRLDEATKVWLSTLMFIPGKVNGAPAEICGYTFDFEWTVN
jgi:TonB family protein